MTVGDGEVRHPQRAPRHREPWAASIAVLGLLLFVWPFLRTPLLGLGASYAHLLGSWAVVVIALALLSRAIGRDAHREDDERA
jgi:hypothetical protein